MMGRPRICSPGNECLKCGTDDWTPRGEGYWQCKKCNRDKAKTYSAKPSSKEQTRNQRLVKFYGITLKEYNALLKRQGGGCAICGQEPVTRALHVDHNHKTGDVRGILCWWCNGLIGKLRDRPELAEACAHYLRSEPFKRGTAVKGSIRKKRRRDATKH